MYSLWIVLLCMMADVMGHGGDGAGDPPLPPGFGQGEHEMDRKSYYNLFIYYVSSFIINILTNIFLL